MMKRVSISDLRDMVAWKRSRHQSPDFWQAKLQDAITAKLKSEVAAQRRKEREQARVGEEA